MEKAWRRHGEGPEVALNCQKAFSTEEQCIEALFKLRWPNGFMCPNCQHDDGFEMSRQGLIQCRLCKHHTSVTVVL